MLGPSARKFALTAHVISSVGWLGSVAAFLALALVGLLSADPHLVRAAYGGSAIVTTVVIVPLCFASLATGLIQALGTSWGLFRHYWVIAKLVITLLSTAILLLHTQAIGHLAAASAERDLASGDLRRLRVQLVADAAAAIIALLIATVLSVYKPQGLTPYGWRKQRNT
jgi:hypothetical protein